MFNNYESDYTITPEDVDTIIAIVEEAMEDGINYCPTCESDQYVKIDVTGTYGAGININGKGSNRLHACLICGTVYIPESVRRRLIKEVNKEKECI